ncbi:isoamyl acetate-hydrolyzing esterase [Coemansia javaensis]|uniref:Isoamyl acetate-hydrolyzing esterase n=1 Tax=Coemansia javaensis TaxID=2761396 RepID=A0A9W8H8F7_9FUNG|nr:isoamyl acetate-hydrolyzing esterase [Coemansia javaensis]
MAPTGSRSSHSLDLVVCLGDSLTQRGWSVAHSGWVAQLSEAYARRLDVVNRGYGGFNSRWGAEIMPRVMPAYASSDGGRPRMRLLTVFFGANDAQYEGYRAHVPLDEYQANLERIIDAVRSPRSLLYSPDTRILLITPPPLGDKLYAEYENPDYGLRKVIERDHATSARYVEAARATAARLGLVCVDLFAAIEARVAAARAASSSKYDGYDEFLLDGLHLNAAGNQLLFDLVTDAISANFPELHPDAMPFVVPAFRDFNSFEELRQMMDS